MGSVGLVQNRSCLALACICSKILCVCMHAKLLQLCLTLCDPMHWSPPCSSVHGIFQSRILEWVAMFSSRGSSLPRDQTHISYVSCIGRSFFTTSPTGKPKLTLSDTNLMEKKNSVLNKSLSFNYLRVISLF